MTAPKTINKAAASAALLEKLTLCVLILLSGAAFYIAGDYSKGSPSDGSVFPRLASGIVCLTSALALVVPAPQSASVRLPDDRIWTPFIVAALTLVFLAAMPRIGYPLLAPVWMGATMWLFGMRNLLVLTCVSIGISALAWILLDRLAFSPPPAGVFAPLL